METEDVNDDGKEIKSERRYKILQVSPEFLVNLCKGTTVKRILVEEFALPADAELAGMGTMGQRPIHVFDMPFGVIGLLVRSETFDDIPVGTVIPVLDAPKFKLLEEAPKGFQSKCPACGELSLIDNTNAEGAKKTCTACNWQSGKK